jgi:hypothetical protein
MQARGAWHRRLIASPALHFLLLGATLLAGDRWLRAGVVPEAGAPTIRITRDDRARLRAEFAEQWGRPPLHDEERAILRLAVDDEVLYREALARGLDRRDRLVRTRLAQLAAFVDESGGEEELTEEARRLGLDRNDLVVRRHLIQSMRLLAARQPADELTEADAAAWYEAQRERFAQPPRVDLEHVYLGRDRRGAALARDATALLARLRLESILPDHAARLGDPFVLGSTVRAATAAELDRSFGPGFADAVARAPTAEWYGPVASAYGLHLVWVRRRVAATVAELDAVRNQVVHGLLKERERGQLRRRLSSLRRQYTIVVEGVDA